ncbi:MAG: hypothetical protein DMF61_16315 [Blastocatellia bacterium AA13]|nr:MAG: hypothetical protein DMF61_16315 [Blastocatellia bacterium AA13]
MTIERIKIGPRMSQAVIHGDTIYMSGQIANDPTADTAGQTRQVLAKIESLLALTGSNKSKLLSASIWLSDISTFDQMNAVWEAWIDPENPPTRATVESKLAGPDLRVEIAMIAAR